MALRGTPQWEAGGVRLQAPSLPCCLADNRKQDNGAGSHSPAERQGLLEWFLWHKHLQENILWKKLRNGHDLCKTVRPLNTTYFFLGTVVFNPNPCLCEIGLNHRYENTATITQNQSQKDRVLSLQKAEGKLFPFFSSFLFLLLKTSVSCELKSKGR